MESLDYWRLCEKLSLVQAALLIVGMDPSSSEGYAEQWELHQRPPGYEAAKHAVASALIKRSVEGTLIPNYVKDRDGYTNEPIEGSVDFAKSSVEVESLRTWLQGRGIATGFFFPTSSELPPYLDSNNPNYSSKLAAAVRAWEAVTTDPTYLNNGKHVKQNLETWLTAHAAEYDLIKIDGDINNDAIKNQIAKVANWKEKGGAPKTPGG